MEGVTVAEAARSTGWNPEYLRRLLRQGIVQSTRVGNVYLVDMDSLLAYTRQQTSDGNVNTGPQA